MRYAVERLIHLAFELRPGSRPLTALDFTYLPQVEARTGPSDLDSILRLTTVYKISNLEDESFTDTDSFRQFLTDRKERKGKKTPRTRFKLISR